MIIVTQSERDWSIPDYTLSTPGCYLPTLMTLVMVVCRLCYIWLVMVMLYLQIDILHPLATLHWKQGPRLPIDGLFGAECVFVNNRLYMGSGIIFPEGRLRNNKQLFVFSANLDLLSESTTPTTEYALTTYNSQPMLVGGRLSSTFKLSNKLWVRNERKGIWNPSLLPPMPTARRYSSAINTGSTECIVVAGGFVDTGPVDVVEVLIGRQWSTLKPLPEPCGGMISTLHDGKWYLSHQDRDNIFCCNLKSLLSGYEQSNDVWSTINDVLSYRTASFGQQLIITLEGSEPSKSILALSPLTQSWVHVGGMPEEIVDFSTIVTIPSTRELVVIGEVYEDKDKNNVFLASLKSEIILDFFFSRRIMYCSLTKAFSTFSDIHYPCLSCSL